MLRGDKFVIKRPFYARIYGAFYRFPRIQGQYVARDFAVYLNSSVGYKSVASFFTFKRYVYIYADVFKVREKFCAALSANFVNVNVVRSEPYELTARFKVFAYADALHSERSTEPAFLNNKVDRLIIRQQHVKIIPRCARLFCSFYEFCVHRLILWADTVCKRCALHRAGLPSSGHCGCFAAKGLAGTVSPQFYYTPVFIQCQYFV